jgi:hypothetical protein
VSKVQLLILEQGEDYQQTVLYEDEAGNPVNNTNMTASMWIAQRGGGPVLLQLTNANNKLVLNGASGFITIKISAADTELLPITGTRDSGRFAYDLKLYNAGTVVKVMRGELLVHRTVTVP